MINLRSGMPFNFGWNGHLLWGKTLIFDPNRIESGSVFEVGNPHLITLYNSTSNNHRGIRLDGKLLVSGIPFNRNLSGAFYFPSNTAEEQSTYGSDCLVGEIMVIRGVASEENHLNIEGYLAHKWGLSDALPDNHLYSKNYKIFSREDPFLSIDNNGTIRTMTTFDHEVEPNLSITIRAIDDEGLSFDKNFTIEISNIVEADLDGDGIEDLHDLDIDGDGVSNILESIYSTDSQNKESYNLPPHSLSSTNELVIMENQPVGTVVGKFQATDPQGNDGLQFSIPPRFPNIIEPLVWLDGADELNIHLNNDFSHIKRWANKAGKHHDFVQSNKAYQPKKNFDNLIKFAGDDYLHSEGSLNLGENFSIIMVAEINLVDSEGDTLLSYGSKYGGPAFQLSAMNSDGFYARFINYNAMGKNKTFLKQPQSEVSIYELIFSLNRSKLEFYLNGYKIGDTAYTNAPSKNHTFRLFTNNNVNNSPTGSIGEALIIRKALDNNERNQIESYLGRKWNVQVQNALSNYMFEISNDGTLYTTSALDFERDKNVTIKVKAIDRQGLFIEREFIVKTQNLIEDRDGDGIEDAYDYDNDNDGIIDFFDPDDDNDGFPDDKEFYWGTNSFDRFSFAYVPMVKTIGHQTISSDNYLLKGEILTNGGAPIIDAGMCISEDVTFRSFDKIQATQWNGKIFSINYQTKTKGNTLYFRAYAENGVGTKNGGLRKIIIPVDIENRSLWSDAEALQGGWVKSPWFGIFQQFPNIDWVYHNKLKWVYINELEDKSIWLWNKRNGWRWTQKDVFPYLFRWRDSAWIYLHTNPSGGALYYNTKSQSIEIED
ncbi:MAG: cadherin repeat domain-containing protein [Opitutae bacterium]|nr:cadherin repeat domain-containing protein [Opitutae bacterium]